MKRIVVIESDYARDTQIFSEILMRKTIQKVIPGMM